MAELDTKQLRMDIVVVNLVGDHWIATTDIGGIKIRGLRAESALMAVQALLAVMLNPQSQTGSDALLAIELELAGTTIDDLTVKSPEQLAIESKVRENKSSGRAPNTLKSRPTGAAAPVSRSIFECDENPGCWHAALTAQIGHEEPVGLWTSEYTYETEEIAWHIADRALHVFTQHDGSDAMVKWIESEGIDPKMN